MTVEELIRRLNSLLRAGKIEGDAAVMVRDLSVSDGAMEAGSAGYIELEQVLVVNGEPHLLITEDGY